MKDKFLPIMLEKKEEISMSNGEEMKVAVLLSMHCFEKNAGNRIKLGLKNSKNASWRGLLGLPHKKYEKLIEKGASGLWHCEGDDIIVDLYSVEMEARRNTKREQTSNAGKASAEARKERANQQGENSTDVEQPLSNLYQTRPDLNGTETDTENVLESSLSERASNPFSKQDADTDKTPARGGDTGGSMTPGSVDEVRAYMAGLSPAWAGREPDLFASIAHDFFNAGDFFSGNDWRDEARKYLNKRLIQGSKQQNTAPLPYPESPEEVFDYLKSLKDCPIEDEQELWNCATTFYGDKARSGWMDEKGKPIKNWKGRAKKYALAWRNNALQAHYDE